MSRQEKILDDLARLAGGTVGILGDAKKQAASVLRAHIDEWAQDMDLVPREDFEKLEAMLAQSRQEQDAMNKRIEALEAALNKTQKPKA